MAGVSAELAQAPSGLRISVLDGRRQPSLYRADLSRSFLRIYDGYRHPISRADLARYLVVCHYGGIYADLDCEALKPLDDLIAGHRADLRPGAAVARQQARPIDARSEPGRLQCAVRVGTAPPVLAASLSDADRQQGRAQRAGCRRPVRLTRACDSYPRRKANHHPALGRPLSARSLRAAESSRQGSRRGPPTPIHHWAGRGGATLVISNARHRILAVRRQSGDPSEAR